MSIALSEFWTRLVRGGIVDAAGCKRMANAFADARGAPASDSASLAEFLVETGDLTEFQSRCLLAAQPVAIRFGDFIRQTDAVSVPLSHWLSVRGVQDGRNGFLIRVGPNQFTENRRQWLGAHAAVTAPSLQPFELHENPSTGIVDVFSELPEGRCLAEITAEKMKVERRQALEVGIAVADALAVMHTRSLVHGAVRADRVWLTRSGKTILLRDPSGPPAPPRHDHSAAWIDVLESPGAYAAPEFADPGFACNPSTDIYSLGCLLFRMIVGRLPFSGPTIDAEIAANVSDVPLELSEAIGQGEAGDPVLRVMAYVMAKSPAARFATARQVSDALKAVLGLIDDSAASESTLRASTPEAPRPQQEPPAKLPTPAVPAKAPREVEPPAAAKRAASSKSEVGKPAAAEKPPVTTPAAETWQVEEPQPKRRQVPIADDKRSKPQPPPRAPSPSQSPAAKVAKPPAASAVGEQVEKARPTEASNAAPAVKISVPPSSAAKPTTPAPPISPPVTASQPAAPPKTAATEPPPPSPLAASTDIRAEATSSETSTGQTVRRRRKKKSNLPFVFGILSVPVLLMIILLIVQGSGGDRKSQQGKPPVVPDRVPAVGQARKVPKVVPQPPPPEATAPTGYQLVNDDKLLWVPPFGADSPMASLELLPPGPSIVVTARLSKLLADPVGGEMIAALSPELAALIKSAADRAQVPQESIERCTVALHAGQEGWPTTSLAIELTEPLPLKTLTDRWQATASRTPDGATVYAGDDPDGDVYYLGDSQQGAVAGDATVKRFAVGPLEQIREVAANEGGVIPLPRLLDKVWSESSVDSDLVALITPNFLFADGRAMIQSTAPELADPVKSVLIPDVAAMLISAKVGGPDLYVEMRVVPSGDVSEARLLRKISDAFASLPGWADAFVVDSVPDPSWRLLATRMPLMLRFLVDHTRFGASDGTIVANAYLPGNAATQIVLAALLAMNTEPGSAAVAIASETAKPLTVEEMLDREMSVDFDQESLEFGINVIVEQFKADLPDGSTMPNVRIVGGDLEKGGITQNQQIRDFSKQNLPLRTVLTDLLLGANPDKTATGPKDPKQALVWVVVSKEGVPGGAEILITTRAASAGVYELPVEFKPEE